MRSTTTLLAAACTAALALSACGSGDDSGGSSTSSSGGKPTASAPGITATQVTVGGLLQGLWEPRPRGPAPRAKEEERS